MRGNKIFGKLQLQVRSMNTLHLRMGMYMSAFCAFCENA